MSALKNYSGGLILYGLSSHMEYQGPNLGQPWTRHNPPCYTISLAWFFHCFNKSIELLPKEIDIYCRPIKLDYFEIYIHHWQSVAWIQTKETQPLSLRCRLIRVNSQMMSMKNRSIPLNGDSFCVSSWIEREREKKERKRERLGLCSERGHNKLEREVKK